MNLKPLLIGGVAVLVVFLMIVLVYVTLTSDPTVVG